MFMVSVEIRRRETIRHDDA